MDSSVKVYQEKMTKTVSVLKEEFNAVRAGRANPHILDKITVDYYGQATPLQQVGNITVPEARMIQIQPWDASVIKAIEKALNMSDIGITSSSDGKVIRLVFPELTEEKRKELTKKVKHLGEEAKVAVRNIRRDAVQDFKKQEQDKLLTEDDLKDLETEIQELTDKFVKEIDKAVEEKTKEIMTV